MKCKNCGAELSYDKAAWGKKTRCRYCRTEYTIDLLGRVEEYKVKIEIYGKVMDFYISEVNVESSCIESTMLCDGRMSMVRGRPIVRLELISM